MYSCPGSLKQWDIFTIKYNQPSFITDHFIMHAMFRPLFHYINRFVFLMISGFMWHMSGTQLLTLGIVKHVKPLVMNMVSIMKWSVAKDNGCIWTMNLYLTISTAVCSWRSKLKRAFIDQLLIHCLWFNIKKENNL